MNHPVIHLTPPTLDDTHIKEKIICIRGHRERMFRTEMETLPSGKTIFHNYGQGGAGWTFLFGCVNESIRQFEKYLVQARSAPSHQELCVVGAGCYGLLTAIELARKGYKVRIVAAHTENLPSTQAAGFFFPRPRKVATPDEAHVF